MPLLTDSPITFSPTVRVPQSFTIMTLEKQTAFHFDTFDGFIVNPKGQEPPLTYLCLNYRYSSRCHACPCAGVDLSLFPLDMRRGIRPSHTLALSTVLLVWLDL